MRFAFSTRLALTMAAAIGCGGAPAQPAAPIARADGAPARDESRDGGAAAASDASVAPAIPQTPAPPRQAAVDTALAREAKGLTSRESKSSEGAITVTTESAAPLTFEIHDRVARITIPIGSDQPIACIVRTDAPPTGALIYGLIADAQKAIPKNQIAQLDVGVVGRIPYFLAELQFLVEDKGKQSLGALKAAAFEREDGTLLCVHEELGYRGSFRRITQEIAKTLVLRSAGTPVPLVDYAVAIAHVGKQAVGYTVERHLVRPDGVHVEVESSSMLLPRSSSDLASIETAKTVSSDAKGVIVDEKSSRTQNGVPERVVVMKQKPTGGYHVEGAIEGKALKGDFTAKVPLWSTWRERRELHDKVLNGPKLGELVLADYVAAVDALNPTATTWATTDTPNVLETASGPVKVEVVVDSEARPVKSTFMLGAVVVIVERAIVEGTRH